MSAASPQSHCKHSPEPPQNFNEFQQSIGSLAIDSLAIDALDRKIVCMAQQINASTYQFLVLVREFDERAGWMKWGLANGVQWLHWRCDIGLSAAREKLRVAHALKPLSLMCSAFESGELSYTKIRALTRVANIENEASLLEYAREHSVGRVEEYCRQLRNVNVDSVTTAERAHARRSLRCWRDHDRGVMTITVEIPMESGELIQKALDKAIERETLAGDLELAGSDHADSDRTDFDYSNFDGNNAKNKDDWSALQSDALVAITRRYLADSLDLSEACDSSGSSNRRRNTIDKAPNKSGTRRAISAANHYQVVLHADRRALTHGIGRSDLPVESMRRLTCDGSIVTMPVDVGADADTDGEINPATTDNESAALNLGRKTRTVSPALKRALWTRDKGCSFPGCTHKRFIDAHHIQHWAHGGLTDLSNLMLLCSMHHRLVHEGGFSIRKSHDNRWYFERPDGRAVPNLGYSREDWIDDDIDANTHTDAQTTKRYTGNPSAEGFIEIKNTKTKDKNHIAQTHGDYYFLTNPLYDPFIRYTT